MKDVMLSQQEVAALAKLARRARAEAAQARADAPAHLVETRNGAEADREFWDRMAALLETARAAFVSVPERGDE